ncbi:MAG: phenylalanine--tRNA ligase subunit beta [Terriglobia bacterium]
MKISLRWLQEFVDIPTAPAQLAEDLTNLGVVVETLENVGDDTILNLDLTTNRPDCLSHYGVAREAATHYRKPLKRVVSSLTESSLPARATVAVRIDAPQLCSRYCARVLRGVRVGPSPAWLSQRLESLGVRSINNIVDVTNYVLLELGHPLHAFDLKKIEGDRIIVREAVEGETLVTIDGIERKLKDAMLLIADERRGLALAGIMGGQDSEIGDASVDVLLESAWFDPVSVRRTSKELAMHSEASHRFERGADIEATVPAIDRAAELIQKLAGGTILHGVVDAYPGQKTLSAIRLRKTRIAQVMGATLDPLLIEGLLKDLNFRIIAKDLQGWEIQLSTSRLDVTREIDLIEEIARHYGYERFPSSLPTWRSGSRRRPEVSRQRRLKQFLAGLGYTETLSYPFVNAAENAVFSTREPVRLMNPLSLENAVMRTSLLPGLLASFLHNYHRGTRTVRLYEMGRLFWGIEGEFSKEEESLGMILSGNAQEKSPHGEAIGGTFFDMKGDVEALFETLGLRSERVRFVRLSGQNAESTYYHPAVFCELWVDETKFGVVGRLHPTLCESRKIRQPVFVAEIWLGSCYRFDSEERVFVEFPKYPAVQRDLSIVVGRETDYQSIESVVHAAGIEEIQNVFPFDLYQGDKLPAQKKGISVSIIFQGKDRTLLEEEINRYQDRIIKLLGDKLGAELRT